MAKRTRLTEAQKLARQANKLGIDLSGIAIPAAPLDTADDIALEAEAVLLYFDLKGKGFEHQICPQCNLPFAYKYAYKMPGMHCSNRCRKAGLDERGIPWHPDRPLEDRWSYSHSRGILPLIVPSESLLAIATTYLGKNVRVLISEPDVYETGILMQIVASGEFVLRRDVDLEIVYCWPWLKIEEVQNEDHSS